MSLEDQPAMEEALGVNENPPVAIGSGMEPAPDDRRNLATVGHLFAWVPIRDPDTEALYAALQIEPDDPVRIFAALPGEAVAQALTTIWPSSRLESACSALNVKPSTSPGGRKNNNASTKNGLAKSSWRS